MKRIRIILSVAILIGTLSGCGNQKPQNNDNQTNNTTAEATTDNSNNTTSNSDSKNADSNTNKSEDKNNNAEKNQTVSSSNDSKDTNITTQKDSDSINSNTSSQDTAKETSKDEKSLYGSWQIKRVVRHSKIVALPDESKFIGHTMDFSNNQAKIVNITINSSNDETKIYDENFANPKYKITNISKEEFAKEFRCEPSELGLVQDAITLFEVQSTDSKSKITPSFIVKDNDTLILDFEGVYFELKRIE